MPIILVSGEKLTCELVLFDLDGTLVDDEDRYRSLAALRFSAIEARAGRRAAMTWAPLGGYDPINCSLDITGPIAKAARREDMAVAAAAIFTTGPSWHEARALAEAAYSDADAMQMKNYTPHLFPGVEMCLHRLKSAGFKMGIATNGPTRITEELLTLLNIRKLFSVVVGSEDASNPKPAPDIILAACEKSNTASSSTIYVGDQLVDAEAAEAAGCAATVIVGHANVTSSNKLHRISSVADISTYP
jgi:HAD superfamily hydrolase (TIGR01549 family)